MPHPTPPHRIHHLGLVWSAAAILAVAVPRVAHADYEAEQNERHLGAIDRGFAGYTEDPAIFDGTAIRPGTEVGAATRHAAACDGALAAYTRYFGQVSSKGRGSERGKRIAARYAKLEPWCKALRTAVDRHAAADRDRAASADQARRDHIQACRAVKQDAAAALTGVIGLDGLLDTWTGLRGIATSDDVRTFKRGLDKLSGVCQTHAAVAGRCQGLDSWRGLGGRNYDLGDVCAPVADVRRSLTDVVMRAVAHSAVGASSDAPSVDGLRRRRGWLAVREPITYVTYFAVSEERKRELTARIEPMFVEAGLAAPDDLSSLWAPQTAWYAELKASVDATASSWTKEGTACKGYECGLGKQQITKAQRAAKVKQVTQHDDWSIEVNRITSVPIARHKTLYVLFQLPGEPYCQLRRVSVHEPYKGGGKYRKATDAVLGEVRFQACK